MNRSVATLSVQKGDHDFLYLDDKKVVSEGFSCHIDDKNDCYH